MYYDNEEWCKIWREIDLLFQNWHEEFDEFWPEQSLKKLHLMDSFWQNYIMFELKKNKAVMFGDTEDYVKFEGKQTCAFKNVMRISQIFTGWKIAISF